MKVTLYAFHFSIARSLYIVCVTGVVDMSQTLFPGSIFQVSLSFSSVKPAPTNMSLHSSTTV